MIVRCVGLARGKRAGRRDRLRPGIEGLEARLQPSAVAPASLDFGPGSPLHGGGVERPTVSITLPPAAVVDASNRVGAVAPVA